jgi:hypothetical protein
MRFRMSWLAVLGMFVASLWASLPAQAQQPTTLCFPNVPGVTHCINDRFLEYWRANGGLAQFGYPLTGEFEQQTPEGRFTVQYFERQRFEFHPENARPFDVLLGRLGDEGLRRQGRDWRADPVPPALPGDVCERFVITNHIVCGDFLIYWTFRKLEITPTTPANFGQSLHLFGLPLMEQKRERNADGFEVDTQWFERSRFEYYPNNPRPFQVLLGRVGAEALNGVQATVGGELFSPNHPANELQIESQRDGSVTTVRYTAATPVVCQGGQAAPANILSQPSIKLFAEGTFDSRGILTASRIVVNC